MILNLKINIILGKACFFIYAYDKIKNIYGGGAINDS